MNMGNYLMIQSAINRHIEPSDARLLLFHVLRTLFPLTSEKVYERCANKHHLCVCLHGFLPTSNSLFFFISRVQNIVCTKQVSFTAISHKQLSFLILSGTDVIFLVSFCLQSSLTHTNMHTCSGWCNRLRLAREDRSGQRRGVKEEERRLRMI